MVVVVVQPDTVAFAAFHFGVERLGVEELVGGDPLEPLDLPVVARRVGAGPLMTGDLPAN